MVDYRKFDGVGDPLSFIFDKLHEKRNRTFGNARVVHAAIKPNAPQLEFRGDFLHAFVNEERVSSNKPVEIIRGKDRFTADSMTFNNLTQVAELKGRVRGVLVPAQ